MHNCAIICEYNPFHTGHEYQINRVRESGAATVFCVMSGNFVQSAMPSFCDKSIRAECAVRGGASAVIELPAVYATASAGYFAEGAVKIISKIRDVTHIAMGATSPAEILLRLAEIRIKRKDSYDKIVASGLKNGKSYNYACANAYTALYESVYGGDVSSVIQEPNNMLCIEYIAALDKFCANIEPLIIMRNGEQHNSENTDSDYISATAIRTAFSDNKADSVARYIPYEYSRIEQSRKLNSPDMEAYKKCAMYAIKCADENKISELRDCAEGMEHAIKNACFASYDDLINSPKLKIYGKKKIDRLLLSCLLDIKKSSIDKPFITRLLACKSDFDFGSLPAFVKTTNAEIKQAACESYGVTETLGIDCRASALYGTLCGLADGYFNYSLVKI